MRASPPPYLPEILAALHGAPLWLQAVVEVASPLLIIVVPGALMTAFFLRLTHRELQQQRRRTEREAAKRLRLQEIRDQLWLESLPERTREEILAGRARAAARERQAEEIWRREQEEARATRPRRRWPCGWWRRA